MVFPKHIVDRIPDWVDSACIEDKDTDDQDDEDNDNDWKDKDFSNFYARSASVRLSEPSPPPSGNSSTSSPLESLGIDVSSNILAHLTLTEICAASLVSRALYHACRSNELWHIKFTGRWNAEWILTSTAAQPAQRQQTRQFEFFLAYQAAYANTHDLWMTHWNIVKPEDGDAPGRCCCVDTFHSRDSGQRSTGSYTDNPVTTATQSTPSRFCCPSCRYTNLLDVVLQEIQEEDPNHIEIAAAVQALAANTNTSTTTTHPLSTRAKAIYASTRYSIAKWLHHTHAQRLLRRPIVSPMGEEMPNSLSSSKRAFASAATFYRQIDTRQYQANSLHFLTDAIFLNVCDSYLKHGSETDLEQVKHEIYGVATSREDDVAEPGAVNTVTHLGPSYELSQHTWHIVRFSNPDYVRPLSFRIFIQRPDCFTAYPSEGYLGPGESLFVFLGVRLLGGFINQATEALNVQREAVDPTFAAVYAHEAHLPYAPFCIRYLFCPVTPCIPPLFASRGGIKGRVRPGGGGISIRKYKHVVSHVWEQVATEATVRTQYVSAHVHANYSYDEFCLDTLVPFDVSTNLGGTHWNEIPTHVPLVHIAPNLMNRFPSAFQRLQNLNLELQWSDAGEAYRTEKSCASCGHDWGPRSEELGRRFVLQRLVSVAEQRKHYQYMQNLVRLLRMVYHKITTIDETNHKYSDSMNWDELYRLLFVLHGALIKNRAERRHTKTQRKLLFRYEGVVDHLCQVVQIKRGFHGANVEDGPMIWRHVGVYRHVRSTDSVFDPNSVVVVDDSMEWKEEPEYLDGFRHLCHNPGMFCLGQQEDPNHDDILLPESQSLSSRHPFHPRQREKASDIFMDNTPLSFASALAMIHDPRSLVLHGMYDRVFSPGTIARRPSLPSPYFARVGKRSRDTAHLAERAAHKLANLEFWLSARHTRDFPIDRIVGRDQTYSTQYNDIDPDGMELVDFRIDGTSLKQKSFFDDFIRNNPAPGTGRFAFSEVDESAERNDDQIFSLSLIAVGIQGGDEINTPIGDDLQASDAENNNGPLLVNLFFLLSSRLGWSIQESNGGSPVMVERRVLIASQWVANSAMAMPVLYTLMARAVERISPKPIDYHLEGIPYELDSEMRYFSPRECAFASAVVFLLWLFMGRYAERKIGRTFERSMMEHLSSDPETRVFRRYFVNTLCIWIHQLWDRLCPMFLQRRVFTPRWNRRTHAEVTDHIRLWRSKDLREHRSKFPASAGRGIMTFGASIEDGGPPVAIWEESSPRKFVTGMLVALGSFSACSPHFSLNALTVFCCSIGLGMSVSLQSIETGRGIPSTANIPPGRSIFRPFGMNTVVIAFVLIGQLVGSSGGLFFLAEFVVTSISLVLGGARTISVSATESWGCFLCLSTTAFWGYIVARVALMDSMRNKKIGTSGVFLCASLVGISLLWMLSLLVWKWDVPSSAMIIRNSLPKRATRKQIGQHLQ